MASGKTSQGTLNLGGGGGSSGSVQFDQLRDAIAKDPALRGEVEAALRLNVDRVNPTDPGNRFVVGGAVEWIVAAAAWSAGALTLPGGHSARGYDLLDLQHASRGLWSVKSQSAQSSSEWRISNGLGGSGKGFDTATIFVAPGLPGLVFVDPTAHTHVTTKGRPTKDAFILPWSAVKNHAAAHPECVAPLQAPRNEGKGVEDPFLSYSKTILEPQRFPRLSQMFTAATPPTGSVVDQVKELAKMRDDGDIDDAMFTALVAKITAQP